jgi:LysR family hca operon transcriptional activator
MELRHLRYFVAVAKAGSLTVAAEKLLHTAQPSLSRQIRDLENDVGVQLMTRNARGIELTAAGKAFLDHARAGADSGRCRPRSGAARGQTQQTNFCDRVLTGQEIDWLPEAMRVLRDELPKIDVTISSQSLARDLGDALMRGKLDVAFLRAEMKT